MTNFALTLKTVITQLFDGNQRDFARTVKISGALVSKILKGGSVTNATLEAITSQLPTKEAVELCRAAIRDYIPPELQEEIAASQPTGTLQEITDGFNHTDPRTEEILRKLRFLVMKDPEARDWLHKTGDWIFPE